VLDGTEYDFFLLYGGIEDNKKVKGVCCLKNNIDEWSKDIVKL
jgi:hypothetical protein